MFLQALLSSSNMGAKILAVSTLLMAPVCAVKIIHPRISDGSDAFHGEFPYMVSVQMGFPPFFNFVHICAGVIRDRYWILTVAHCIDKLTGLNGKILTSRVVTGVHNLNDFDQIYQIVDKVVHEMYNRSEKLPAYDIGLLKVYPAIELNIRVKQANLAESRNIVSGDVIIAGWGRISSKAFFSSPNCLQKAHVRILDHETCQGYLEDGQKIQPWHKCTRILGVPITACKGDSGGPAALKSDQSVIGLIFAIVKPCGSRGHPTISIEVGHFLPWIADKIASR